MAPNSFERAAEGTGGRAMCYRCFKPALACVCADVEPVDNRTGVILLQHPRERHHAFGTERFARLGLRRVQIRECGPKAPETMACVSTLPPNTALLYPSPDAVEVGSLTPSERPDHIVLVDATWPHAAAILRCTPWLHALPRIRLAPATPSEYRVRREPRPDYRSTIEAIVGALRALEPETAGFDQLLTAFRRMIDRQSERTRGSLARRIQAPRPPRTPVPREFTTRYSRLVVVYGEVVNDRIEGEAAREIVYWCAVRPATGEVFARFVRPARATLTSKHIAHMGLDAEQILAGHPSQRLRDDWARFAGPDAIVAAWSRHSLSAAMAPGESLRLKEIVCNLSGRGCGHLHDFVRRAGLTPGPTQFEGRAGRHMGHAVAVARYLRQLGLGDLSTPTPAHAD